MLLLPQLMSKLSLYLSQEIVQRTCTGIILALGLLVSYLYAPPYAVSGILLATLTLILLYEWPLFRLNKLTLLYPVGPFIMLLLLNNSVQRTLLPFLFVIVGSYEVGAYAVGKVLGKHKLVPSISPGKTWEGLVGGYGISLIIALWYISVWGNATFDSVLIAVTLLVAAATLGDLFESYLKRRARLKDAGSLLPGHGGLLDRLDGILGAIVILYPLRTWFVAILGLI